MSGGLIDALVGWLFGESFFSYTQTSMSEMLRVMSDSSNRQWDRLRVVAPALEHFYDVLCSARANPKPVWFRVIDTSLYLDTSKGYVCLPCASSGRCCLHELLELLEVYVLQGTYIVSLGISWYRSA
jgi:hypothetical protein